MSPLTTRSIVLSLLLGSHPPELPVASLVEFCALFDIAGGTVRTTLSRMVERGELAVDDAVYRLSGRLLDRQADQDVGRARRTVDWDDDWWIVIVTAERRSVADRRAFRSRAVGAKLGELRADLWMRPADLAVPTDLAGVVVTRGPLLGADDVQMARSLWDLEAIDEHSRALTDALDGAGRVLAAAGPQGLPPAFGTLARPFGTFVSSRSSPSASTPRRPATRCASDTARSSGPSGANCRRSCATAERRPPTA